jgi:hypothetical protein
MTDPFDELLSGWDAEIEAALRAAEDELPRARQAVLEADEAAANLNDFAHKIVLAFAGREPMPLALVARIEEMELKYRSAMGMVSLRKQEVMNLEYRITDLYAALARVDRARQGNTPDEEAPVEVVVTTTKHSCRGRITYDPIVMPAKWARS